MQKAKRLNRSSRDRLVLELADRGINYFKLPPDLFEHRMRHILEWLKQHYNITYCYRCQRLTEPEEMIGTNVCRLHDKGVGYQPDEHTMEIFKAKMGKHVDDESAVSSMRGDIANIFNESTDRPTVDDILAKLHPTKQDE